jgi:hypothetical protein
LTSCTPDNQFRNRPDFVAAHGSPVGTSVWTGRALRAGFDRSGDYWSRASVFGPLSGACCSWPSWISARIRSHSRQGPGRPYVPRRRMRSRALTCGVSPQLLCFTINLRRQVARAGVPRNAGRKEQRRPKLQGLPSCLRWTNTAAINRGKAWQRVFEPPRTLGGSLHLKLRGPDAAFTGRTPELAAPGRYVARQVEKAAAGGDVADAAVALRLALMLEKVECRPQ